MEQQSKKALKELYKKREVIGGVYCVKCTGDEKLWIRATTNMQGARNRFSFFSTSGSCPEICMTESWNRFGASAFVLEVLEEITKKETQSADEFSEDVNTLLEIWSEKLAEESKP